MRIYSSGLLLLQPLLAPGVGGAIPSLCYSIVKQQEIHLLVMEECFWKENNLFVSVKKKVFFLYSSGPLTNIDSMKRWVVTAMPSVPLSAFFTKL